MTEKLEALIHRALDDFHIELPSWGFANTGTRFGKFIQLAAAVSLEDKFSDAGQVHAFTGACPNMDQCPTLTLLSASGLSITF